MSKVNMSVAQAERLLGSYDLSLDMFYTVHVTDNDIRVMGYYSCDIVKKLKHLEWSLDCNTGHVTVQLENINITLW